MSAIKLPTNKEIDRAVEGYGSVGPQPLAQICDEHEMLAAFIDKMVADIWAGHDMKTAVKATLVLGLNVGIRIGEGRK